MGTRGSYVHNSMVKKKLGGGAFPQIFSFMQFSQNIDGFLIQNAMHKAY